MGIARVSRISGTDVLRRKLKKELVDKVIGFIIVRELIGRIGFGTARKRGKRLCSAECVHCEAIPFGKKDI